MSETESTIRTHTDGRVGWITLDRPRALNALTAQLMREVVEAAAAFDRSHNIGAIVVTGSTRAFAAGVDIAEMEGMSSSDMLLDDPFALWERFAEVRTPVVAAVAGYALGGGCELAMMCDLIIAADDARFGQPEIRLGIIPGMGGTQRLLRAVGPAKAADLVLTGRQLSAEEAERAGLVARVVPAEHLLEEAADVAAAIASHSLPALYAATAALDAAQEGSLSEGLRFERRAFAQLFDTVDQSEGMAAFREKRTPEFRHR
ncbi:enoyl-CoA hydratase-related protein [Microbacterium album]|uniref:enoyl-CoA hydratase n=1 Tax=Microbacterium album TaxID=2053191 RepID=A0A917IF67_9MICO|nr:enoyl-CoA hydratase-related protein [Microbacterium album]GGH47260.1 putative enoyl-CoA hydratase echA8 [Microbacterium album]